MLVSKIEEHETSFGSTKKDSNGTQYSITEFKSGQLTIHRLTPENVTGYYYTDIETKKTIVLHYTVGYLKGDLATLCKNNEHMSVAYVVARNGIVYELFNPKYWSYHLGKGAVGGNEVCSKRSIGIELSNIGPLSKSGDDFITAYGDKYCGVADSTSYTKLATPYRGNEYFATFTDKQYESLNLLLEYLCTEFSIPKTLLPVDKRYDVFADDTTAKSYTGISSHVNYRATGKTDIGPGFDWSRISGAATVATKSAKFPVNIGSGIDGTAANATAYFNHTEKDASGGYFPVGTNTVWHGGVHIRGKEKDPIHACFDGKIIAARLSDNPALSEGHYGSRNFLLLEHQFGKSKIFCLYMHLYSKVLSNKEIQDGGYKWLLDPPKVSYEVASGQSVSYRSLPGVNSNPNSKELGTLSAGSKLEILSTEKDPDGDSWNKIKLSNGTVGYIIASSESKGRIRKVASGTTTGEVNQALLLKIKSGRVEKLDIPVKAGDSLWGMGLYGSEDYRTSLLHWEVFSTENVLSSIKGNVEIKDLDDDFNMDSSNIMHLFKKYQNDGYWDDDEILEPDELRKFFQSSTEREFVRKYSCQFTSEWGIVNLEEAIRGLKGRWVTYGLKDRMKPYIWWQDAFNAGVGIPKSASVWHFNPIFTLQHFGGLLAATTPSTPAPGSPSPQIPSGGGNANTNWTNGYHRNITDQNKYNTFIQNSATAFGLNPFILKSLIAQESGFDPKARNNGGYAGLTQVGGAAIDVAGFNIGDTAKSSGKWVFDLTGDERFDPEKSIQGGAKVLAAKIKSVNTLIFNKYTSPASDDEKIKFYLAAYNGGEGTVLKAYKACGVVNAKWDDLIKGKESSGLWAAIPESWGQEKKYDEITKYVEEIIARASQGGSSANTQSSSSQSPIQYKKGQFDDVAVSKYSTRTKDGEGYVAGNQIQKLQNDLTAIGIVGVGVADGDFGDKTEKALNDFQQYAQKGDRKQSEKDVTVSPTYTGSITGIADQKTLDEIKIWIDNGYKVPGSTTTGNSNIFVTRNGSRVPFFCQADPQWGTRILGDTATISGSGCAITSVAMFLKYYGRDVTPKTLDEYLDSNSGYDGDSVNWGVAIKHKEIAGQNIKHTKVTANISETLDDRISKNVPTLARVDYGKDTDSAYNHFVVIVGKTGDGHYIMNDPATSSGNGTLDPNKENVVETTTRKNGYKIVAIDCFDL